MIDLLVVRNVFEPSLAQRQAVPWREGMRASDLISGDLVPLRDSISAMRGTQTIPMDELVRDGERLALIVTPGAALPYIVYTLVLIGSYFLTKALIPRLPKAQDDDSSNVYGFSGIRANRTEGEPIPRYYGELRVGGQIVGEFIESRGALGSAYNVLISMGEGPVYSLAGRTTDTPIDQPLRAGDAYHPLPRGWVFINDTDAADIPGTEVHVRLGTLEQEEIAGMSTVSQTVTVDAAISGPASDVVGAQVVFANNNTDPTTAADGVTASTSLWASYGTGFSAATDADEFTIVVEFPSGLFLSDATTGATQSFPTQIAIRYIELDGGGTPIASGGPEGDGYVRLRPTRSIALQTQSSFALDYRFPFLDPQTYSRPAQSRALALKTVDGLGALPGQSYASGTSFGAALAGASGVYVADFSIEAWVQLRPSDLSNPNVASQSVFNPATILHWLATSGAHKGGFWFYVQSRTFTIAPGHTRLRAVPVLVTADPITGATSTFYEKQGVLGDPTGVVPIQTAAGPPLAESFFEPGGFVGGFFSHVVVTYKNDADGSLDRVRIYVDSVLVLEVYAAIDAGYPTGQALYLGRDGAAGSNCLHGWLDEVVVWRGELSPDDVRASFNGGAGRTTPPDPIYVDGSTTNVRIQPALILHFDALSGVDTGSGAGQTLIDSAAGSSFSMTTAFVGGSSSIRFGPTFGPKTFIDQNAPTNTRKRGRYRVEVMRALADVDSQRVSDDVRWRSLLLHLDDRYTYPTSPLLGVRVPATEQINGGAPSVTARGKFALLPVWDGASTVAPSFLRRFSSSPAGVVIDAALDPVFGLGRIFKASDIDVEAFADWDAYCAEPVYDQRGSRIAYPDWTDMRFDSGLLGAGGAGIEISMPPASLPAHLEVGDFVGWYGLPAITASGTFEDTNVDPNGGGGYEIAAISPDSGGTAFIYVYWRGSLLPWTNGTLLSTQVTGALSGTIEGRERRFEYDGAADTAQDAWEFIIQVCASARAVPIRDGRRLTIAIDRPRDPVDLVGMSQVVVGTFEAEYLSPRTRDNAIEIGFLDRDLNYERSTASDEHSSIKGSASLSAIRRKTYFREGVVRRTQILREILYLLNVEHDVRRRVRFISSLDLIGYAPGTVLRIAHDVMARGVSGRVLEGSTDTNLLLDREIVLESGKDYRVAVRRAAAASGVPPEVVDVDVGATGLGSVVGYLGVPIVLATPLQAAPTRPDVFIFFEVGSDLLVSIDSATTTADLRREITASQYVESVYAVDGVDQLADLGNAFALVALPADGGTAAPAAPSALGLREILVRGPGGSYSPGLAVSWAAPASSYGAAAFDVFVARGSGPFSLAASAAAPDRAAEIAILDASPGETLRVSVVARARSGARRPPEIGAVGSIRVLAAPASPLAPSALSCSMVGEAAVYSFALPAGGAIAGGSLELRRGGWILGQVVGSTPDGIARIGPSGDFASASGSIGASLYLRRRDGRGAWSSAAASSQDSAPEGSVEMSDVPSERLYSVSWESFGVGWKFDDATTPNATFSGVRRRADGALELDDGYLEGTYTTAEPTIEGRARVEDVLVSAFAEASQIHPLTWDEMIFSWDDPRSQWTWEGPLNDISDGEDAGRATLAIEARVMNADREWGDWLPYKPTRLVALAVQFRLRLTRPSEEFNARVERFSTELLRAAPTKYDQDDFQSFVRGRTFRRG